MLDSQIMFLFEVLFVMLCFVLVWEYFVCVVDYLWCV